MKPFSAAARARHEKDLLEVTAIPTATGCEDRVVGWVQRWAKRRAVSVERDVWGNLMLRQSGTRRTSNPLVLAAHLDHPAFVVTAVDGRGVGGCAAGKWTVEAEFRGGVGDAYFVGTKVRLWRAGSRNTAGVPGRVMALRPADPAVPGSFKTATLTFARRPAAAPGDFATWDLGGSVVKGAGAKARLHAPVCDNLAGLAAGLAAFGERLKGDAPGDVRFLCTRAEEVGFVGAVGAVKSGLLPGGARVVVLENSKASDHAPQGAGPVVRVGDATSTFDPQLTGAAARAGQSVTAADPAFRWQRRLMTGGTCEASAYAVFGLAATCVCLPLGNYHNMDETKGRVAREFIALDDFHGMVRLLAALGAGTGGADATGASLAGRLNTLFAARSHVLAGGPHTA